MKSRYPKKIDGGFVALGFYSAQTMVSRRKKILSQEATWGFKNWDLEKRNKIHILFHRSYHHLEILLSDSDLKDKDFSKLLTTLDKLRNSNQKHWFKWLKIKKWDFTAFAVLPILFIQCNFWRQWFSPLVVCYFGRKWRHDIAGKRYETKMEFSQQNPHSSLNNFQIYLYLYLHLRELYALRSCYF